MAGSVAVEAAGVEGICAECDRLLQRGQLVVERAGSWQHKNCPSEQGGLARTRYKQRKRRKKVRVFPARYQGRCSWCRDTIWIGELMTRGKQGWCHEECAQVEKDL